MLVVELVATTETLPDNVNDAAEEETTVRVPKVLTETPLKALKLFNETLIGETAKEMNVVCICEPELPVSVTV